MRHLRDTEQQQKPYQAKPREMYSPRTNVCPSMIYSVIRRKSAINFITSSAGIA